MSFCSILNDAATDIPDQPLYIFPETRWGAEESFTYGELATRSGSAARCILDRAQPGERVLLLFPTGAAFWEAFFGCLAAGVIAVPLKLPNFNRTNEQLERVCRDCTPSAVLTTAAEAELLSRRNEHHPYLDHIPVLTEQEWREGGAPLQREVPSQGAIAFLQYTSGSTSHPKGVMVSHANLLANSAMIRDRMALQTGRERTVIWLPHYHDMGLVGSYLGIVFIRSTAWCLPPEEFVLRPERWLQLISEHRATVCGGPDFAYRMCAQRVTDEQLAGVDLSTWRCAFNGAERIRPDSIRSFARRFAPFGFREQAFFPCYGLGEATLMVTGGPESAAPTIRQVSTRRFREGGIGPPEDEGDVTELVGSGQTIPDCRVLIVDPQTSEVLADDEIGHILASGDNVTGGYFHGVTADDEPFVDIEVDGRGRRFLKTGDLGFLSSGELFVTGRLRELMIFRGRNYFPEDIEEHVWNCHGALAPGGAAAFSVDEDEDPSLIVAVELRRAALKTQNMEELIGEIRGGVVEAFGINPREVLLFPPSRIPRTSSGKPKRMLLRDHYQQSPPALATVARG